jgi:hypothetical protein
MHSNAIVMIVSLLALLLLACDQLSDKAMDNMVHYYEHGELLRKNVSRMWQANAPHAVPQRPSIPSLSIAEL